MEGAQLSISLSQSWLAFVEDYQRNHAFSSHSQVIEKALELLREQALKETYTQLEEISDPLQSVAIGDEPIIQSQQTVLQRMGGVPKHLLSVSGLSDRETRRAVIAQRIQAHYQARS